MKSLKNVKKAARELRSLIASQSEDLFQGICKYVFEKHQIRVRAVPSYELGENQAELSVSERTLEYDEALDKNPIERLLVVAHELGHLDRHKRLTDIVARVDPLSPYLNTGAPALARYNRFSREEIEADAFANEFVCPAEELFGEWETDDSATSRTLAEKYGFTESFVKARLSEGLYEKLLMDVVENIKDEAPKTEDTSQIEAATHTGTPALVNAGPGTGKTATLIMRMKYLLRKPIEAKPYEMLVLTFSNEAADELRSRIEEEFGAEVAEEMEITTFHGFGHSQLLGWESPLSEDFQILDESRQEELILDLLGKIECDSIFNLKKPEETARNAVRQICWLKERRISPDILEAEIKNWEVEEPVKSSEQRKTTEFLKLFRAYEEAKTNLATVDFADLINLPLEFLENNSELVKAIRAKYKWVMVDEYQDVSRAVAALLGKICGSGNPPWVVGDMRQAIYLFCGAAKENVSSFPDDFEKAKIFELGTNYRSCDEIIEVANQLAELMECPVLEKATAAFSKRWTKGTETVSLEGEKPVIRVAQADSDTAEYEAIAQQVKSWLKQGVKPQDIAVLARRNKDVRNISLALGRRGIKATTTGLITPEGAAGDLAAVATYLDGRLASLPKIVYALGKDRFKKTVLNAAVEYLSETDVQQPSDEIKELVQEVALLDVCLSELEYSGDAFSVICAFLFDGSSYLRSILNEKDEAKRSLALSEILTTLSWAVGYRYSHPETSPKESRIGFGQYFRNNLSSGKPNLVAPRPATNAVQVMTCHASKGLEFPCVILAGQTLSLAKDTNWLPPRFEPKKNEDIAQANALFFVGVTRAQRALFISYAKTPKRTITPLLEKWQQVHGIQVEKLPSAGSEKETVVLNPIWGKKQSNKKLASSSLSKGKCGILIYLEEFYGARFPTLVKPLYPRFFVAVRTSLEKIIRLTHESNQKVTITEAEAMFKASFSDDEVLSHPHYAAYNRRGINYAGRLAEECVPQPRAVEFIEIENVIGESDEELLPLRLDLIAHFRDENKQTHAILFRPESFGEAKSGELAWSNLESTTSKRMPFVLLRKIDPKLQPWIFSGEDGKIYRYKWNRNAETMNEDAAWAEKRLRAFSGGNFEASINEFFCDTKCGCRVPCPHWMEAIE
ncbi:MAG TPA: UvrD-helicase domain-containing protein [Pyrinomonadaceae bacterium]|jgi:superfamily I DNA/RNA helicase